MKLIPALFFFALLLVSVTARSSDFYSYGDESMCRREMERLSMESCRNFMRYGHEGMMMESGNEYEEMRAPRECCHQLRQVSRECRCPIIRNMMQEMMREEEGGRQGYYGECRGRRCGEMMMRGRYLPAMCNIEPQTCRMQQQGY